MTMRHYLVLPRRDVVHADSYWVLAASGEEARRLVALNVPGAAGAADRGEFECVLNDQRQPPPGYIYTQIDRVYVASR
jgi:hypothetical protein